MGKKKKSGRSLIPDTILNNIRLSPVRNKTGDLSIKYLNNITETFRRFWFHWVLNLGQFGLYY